MIYIYVFIAVCLLIPILWLFLKKYMNTLVERRIASYQNELVAKHCDEVENIYNQMRGWRHDYHNHIQAMQALVLNSKSNQIEAPAYAKPLLDYLNKLNSDLTGVDTVLKTGNVLVDAILNSKISLAQSKKITIKAKATIPKNLCMQEVDLCIIIGNLLDNAIESCVKLLDENERFIRIYIGMHKELFYISISNSVGGHIKKSELGYLSTKPFKLAKVSSHGLGLVRIDKIIEKYKGFIDRQDEPGVFVTEIMLPL